MLKQRVLTALLLLPLALAAIFALPEPWFLAFISILLLAGSYEYTRIAGFSGHVYGYFLVALQAMVIALLYLFVDHLNEAAWLYLSASCVAWLVMLMRLPLFRIQSTPNRLFRSVSFFTALVSISAAWFALTWLRTRPEGSWLLLLLLLIVWAADTGAYFFGKAYGRKKLAPKISPGKTLAGLLGGLVLAPLVALLAAHWMPLTPISATRLILLSLLIALVSVGGDLLISLHKRVTGCKDSGNLLPGHGGILDRLDSLLAAAPFFGLGLLIAEI